MTRLMFIAVLNMNQTHNSTLYACDIALMFGSSYEQGPNLCKPRASSMSSKPLLKAWDKTLVRTLN